MKKMRLATIGVTTAFAIIIGCQPDNKNLTYETDNLKLPAQTYNYSLPGRGEAGGIAFTDNKANPITNDGATLGRVLFYDKKLSLNNQIACASCHRQENGFADPIKVSVGFAGNKTTRNSSTIVNAGLQKNYFWDGRSSTLEDLALRPIQNHIEMGIESMDKLSVKLNKIAYYPDLFEKAFGSKEISGERISQAMAQFLRSMVSYKSAFDLGKQNNFKDFTQLQRRGMELFTQKLHCGKCHGGDNLDTPVDGTFGENIGLDENYSDNGMGKLTGISQKNGHFKVPSLRNIELTAPYMHDGRFTSLIDVVNHYDHGMKNHPNLKSDLRTFVWEGNLALVRGNNSNTNVVISTGWGGTSGGDNLNIFSNPTPLLLTEDDKSALVHFLKTLTDKSVITDERFSNPFN